MRSFLFRLIGILEIAGGFLGVVAMVRRLLPLGSTYETLMALIGLALFGFILIAGVLLLEGSERGVTLSRVAQLLQLLGHNIYVAYGGIEAIDVAKEFHPEIVLLDIGLPGLNGYEVARRLRKDDAKPYIVAISGYGSSEALSRGVEAGFDKHLLKPIDIDNLIEILAAFKV